MSRSFVIRLLCLARIYQCVAFCNYNAVQTNVGVIKGLMSRDGVFYLYMGIPFALVNSSNPFGIATEYPNFERPYNAYDDGAICPQFYQSNNSAVGSLDCLRLNIYVPVTASSRNKLPVMIWIYGGRFQRGAASLSSYGPKYLVRYNVILVTINYRVGPYGFMCLDTAEVPGNQGLKDQYMAIKWVYDNIEAFGGDVDNITLFGESAGGHSIELHLRSQYNILFNKVIMESGSAVAGTVFTEPDKQAPLKLAKYLGYITSDLHQALAFLTSTEPKRVIEASIALNMSFKPCVEKPIDGVNNFLTTTWIDRPVPKIANMPVLLGFNENERMSNYVNKDAAYFDELELFKDNLQLTFNFSETELIEMKNLVRRFYIGDEPISKNVVWPILDFDSDFTYIHPVQRSMKQFIESGAGNVYYYMFSYSGGRNVGKSRNNVTMKGTAHEDEMGYLFGMSILPDVPTAADQLILDRMTRMWTNFAKYGDPTPKTSYLLPVKWTPVSAETVHCMKINSSMTLIARPLHDRMAFWDLFYKMNKKSLKTFDD